MSKLRVYELARDLKIESKMLVTRMKSIGIDVQSHQSTLTDEQVDRIKKLVSGELPEASVKPAAAAGGSTGVTKVIRRQRRPLEVEGAASEGVPGSGDAGGVTEGISGSPEVSPDSLSAAQSVVAVASAPDIRASTTSLPGGHVGNLHSSGAVALQQPADESRTASAQFPGHASGAAGISSTIDSTPSDALRRRPPGPSAGATIVRRATPEELAASRHRQEQRESSFRGSPGSGPPDRRSGAPFRREDSRGTRIAEGFGGGPSSSGMGGGFRGGPRTQEGFGMRAPQIPAVAPEVSWEDEDSRRREKERVVKKHENEETEEERKNRIAKAKRSSGISTRMLLNQIDDVEGGAVEEDLPLESVEAPAAPVDFQSKTVYTPSATARKKDLRRRKDLKRTQITTPRAAYRVVSMSETITVNDLAHQMSIKASDIIKKLMNQGLMATMNQALDVDTTTLIAQEYGFEVENKVKSVEEVLALSVGSVPETSLEARPPIVTVMGHVDHGKTSILDAIRQTKVAAGEAGGITQHIGAYTVERKGRAIAFLDTPGHEAFSSMRARGASLTDIVILVVAADDGVMPQTVEAISHAKAANVPIIVAINKIDKPNINFDRVYRELSEHGIQSEEWGGEHQFVKVSALQKTGLDELLEAVLLQADVLELRADPTRNAEGAVIEAHLDTGRGPVATIMVRSGTLNIGDFIVAGFEMGKVRAMNDHRGRRVVSAPPSTPVEVLGLSGVPQAGDAVNAVVDERTAREVIGIRSDQRRNQMQATSSAASLAELLGKVKKSESVEVALIIKADTQGSLEAISESVTKLNTPMVRNRLVHRAVGGITESDLALAEATKAVIVGFNVRAARGLDELAERRGIVIKYFSIIYNIVDAIKSLMAGQLPPIVKEVILGHAEVRQAISVPKVGTIAGSSVIDGKISRTANLRLIRDDVVVYSGKIGSLRRFKDDVREVQQGYECGIGIDGYNDIKTGDVIEAFMLEEHAATL